MKPTTVILFVILCVIPLYAQDYFPIGVKYSWTYQSIKADGTPGNFFEKFIIVEKYSGVDRAFVTEHKLFVGDKEVSNTIAGLAYRNDLWLSFHKTETSDEYVAYVEFQPIDKQKKRNAWLVKNDDKEREDCEVIGTTDVQINGISYKNVLKVKRETTIKIEVPEGQQKQLVFYDYYAPNVGLVQKEGVVKGKPVLLKVLKEFKKD